MKIQSFNRLFIGIALTMLTHASWADGLSDLKLALSKLDDQSPVSGVLHVSFSESRDDGDDQKTKTGNIKSLLSHNKHGLDIRYADTVLSKISVENKAKLVDEDVDTPTLNGAEVLSASSIIPILSSAHKISEYIEQGEFIKEEPFEKGEQEYRLLHFALPLESFIDDKKIRGYVSKFEGSYGVVIDNNGVPVETRMSYAGKGSAYIFFSLSAKSEIISTFQVNGSRLIQTNRTVASNSSSTFNDRTYSSSWQLTVN